MGVFNNFPYTNFHELNQDWIIETVKKLSVEWAEYQLKYAHLYDDINTAFEAFKAEFDDFIDSIDVDEEFRQALDSIIEDGTFLNIVSPVISSTTSTWLAQHITQPTTPAIDTSLTVAGAAADAKAVGDKFNLALLNQGFVPNGADYNDIRGNGVYNIPTGRTFLNGPPTVGSGLLYVMSNGVVTIQIIYYVASPNKIMYTRYSLAAGWQPWVKCNVTPSEIENMMSTKGYLATGTDLNDYIVNGFYGLSDQRTYYNGPREGIEGLMGIYDLTSVVIQTVTDTRLDIEYIRWYLRSTGVWHAWKQVGVSMADLEKGGAVSISKNADLFYVRAPFDDTNDVVTNFAMPNYQYNFTFNFLTVRLIPHDTPQNETRIAFQNAPVYKLMNDDIPAIDVNGVYLGSNHGNPNYTQCYCVHSLTEAAIGTVWTDNNGYSYTIVQVFNDYIIAGSLNDDELTVRSPESLRRSGVTLTITDSNSYQLRRSAINKKWTITDETGRDIYNGGAGTAVIVTENYDIQNQSKGLQLLQNNVGNNTNDSYFSDDNPYIIAHVENVFRFNRGGSITAYGSVEAKEAFTDTRIYGMMSKSFNETDGATEYAYIPQSSNFASRRQVPTGSDTLILKEGSVTPYRYYQYGGNRGYFMQYINNLGDTIPAERNTLQNAGHFSVDSRLKLYPIIKRNIELSVGDKLTWGYGRGPMNWTARQPALAFFEVGNGWIASADWSNGFSGYMKLPEYMSGHEFEVIEKTNSVTVIGEYVTNDGIKVNCTGYGYCVLRIK